MRGGFGVRVFLAVFVFLFLFPNFSGAKTPEVERVEREKEWKNLMSEIRMVVRELKDQEVEEIYTFLERNSVLGAPHREGTIRVLERKKKNSIIIVPLLKRDEPSKKRAMRGGANFIPEANAIIVKVNTYSPAGKTLILMHEGYRASEFLKEPDWDPDEDNEKFCRLEMEALEFSNRLLTLLGGPKYQKILKHEILRIKRSVQKKGEVIGDYIPGPSRYHPDLAKIFGKPLSQEEQDYLKVNVWIHGVFSLMDESFLKKEAKEEKIAFIKRLYKREGVLM